MTIQHRMEEIRERAAREIADTLHVHLEHIKSESLNQMKIYPYNQNLIEASARVTESLAKALAEVSR